MVKLSEQDALLLLHPLALGYIDVNTNHPLGLSIAIVRNQLACLDPPVSSTANNSILCGIFAPPFVAGLVPQRLQTSKVLGVHPRLPSAEWDFGRSFG